MSVPAPKLVKPRTKAEKQARLDQILAILDQMYPNVTCALHHTNPFELLVATILSAQCTDERVNMVTPALFAKYPTMEDFAAATPEALGKDIYSTGFYNNKAKNIIAAAKRLLEVYGGEIPRNIEDLLTIPGAARKTANVVLGTAFQIASGVVVDTHVSRISQRLDLTRKSDPVQIERDLVKILPQSRWIEFSHQLIHHGRGHCTARNPKCFDCPMNAICYANDKNA
jgi:endonuclease III